MSEPVTSSISVTRVGTSVRNRQSIYTATRVTQTQSNPPTYQTEIIRYADAKGNTPTVIGTRNPSTGRIDFNDNSSTTDRKNSAALGRTSTNQMNSPEIQATATNASQQAALNSAAGQSNQAQGSGTDAATSTTSSGNTRTRRGQGGRPLGDTTRRGGAVDASADPPPPPTAATAEVVGRMRFPNPLVYPTALTSPGTDRDVIRFNMMKYEPSGFTATGAGTRNRTAESIIGSVVLPVPGGISDTNMADWSSGTMNPIQAAGANAAMKAFNDNLEKGAVELGKSVTAALESTIASDALKGFLAGTATGIGQQATQRTAGAVMNPNMELLFNGPQLRNFGFNFKLSPRSAREAQTVIKIIRFFKQGMAPLRTKERFFLKSPHTFQLKYQGPGARGDQPYLNKFKECALTNCGVQYTPDGNYNTFNDGVMTSYSLQLTFNELTPIYNDDYTGLDGDEDTMIGY